MFAQWFNIPLAYWPVSNFKWDYWTVDQLYPTINYTGFGCNNMAKCFDDQILSNRFALKLNSLKTEVPFFPIPRFFRISNIGHFPVELTSSFSFAAFFFLLRHFAAARLLLALRRSLLSSSLAVSCWNRNNYMTNRRGKNGFQFSALKCKQCLLLSINSAFCCPFGYNQSRYNGTHPSFPLSNDRFLISLSARSLWAIISLIHCVFTLCCFRRLETNLKLIKIVSINMTIPTENLEWYKQITADRDENILSGWILRLCQQLSQWRDLKTFIICTREKYSPPLAPVSCTERVVLPGHFHASSFEFCF